MLALLRHWTRLFGLLLPLVCGLAGAEDWLQYKFDGRHSGNVPDRRLQLPLGLVAAIPLSDAIFTAPVVYDGCAFVVDGSGVVACIDLESFQVRWRFATAAGPGNCNNISSPAIVAGKYLHLGTMAGKYYVLNLQDGSVVRELPCGEPIFSCPVVGEQHVYFATLGARVYAVTTKGEPVWTWDFVEEEMGFRGDRWNGADWVKHKQGRVTWEDHFCCSRDLALFGDLVVVPAGGKTVWLRDAGDEPQRVAIGLVPDLAGKEFPATFGQSIGEDGTVYRQWHRRDNYGRVDTFRLQEGELQFGFVPGTETGINLPGALSFSSVSMRGGEVFRCRPEADLGCCRHSMTTGETVPLGGYPSISSPILLQDVAVYGGLDGKLHVVPLSGKGRAWSFATAFGRTISAPVAVCDGRVLAACEDGYLYVLGPGGRASLPTDDLGLTRIRSPLTGRYAAARYDWFTNYGDQANTNANDQGLQPPLEVQWVRRYEGTFKHLPVCGGGRMYTHTSEGQVFAVEQETGRLLWRSYWPGVHLSFTSPLYYGERLLVPQAGPDRSWLRCLDARDGRLLWETPFTGSPSWSRQAPPIVHGKLAIYASGSGVYAPQGTETPFVMKGQPQPRADGKEVMSWIYTHNNPYYPRDNQPLLWAWDLDTGKLVWTRDFSQFGSGGNDCGLCLLDDTLYYSTFFGYSASQRQRRGLPAENHGLTAALDPQSGRILWQTDKYYVTAGCTLSAADGRLYLGGYNQPREETSDRFIWCLNAADGSLVWQSEPVKSAVNVITIGRQHIFSNASGGDGHVLDRESGKIVGRFNFKYACTRFTLSEPFLLGANMDVIDLSRNNTLVSSGPTIDSRECVGATVSNGRMYYTSQASGLQICQVSAHESTAVTAPWRPAEETP